MRETRHSKFFFHAILMLAHGRWHFTDIDIPLESAEAIKRNTLRFGLSTFHYIEAKPGLLISRLSHQPARLHSPLPQQTPKILATLTRWPDAIVAIVLLGILLLFIYD